MLQIRFIKLLFGPTSSHPLASFVLVFQLSAGFSHVSVGRQTARASRACPPLSILHLIRGRSPPLLILPVMSGAMKIYCKNGLKDLRIETTLVFASVTSQCGLKSRSLEILV